jgi:hypothetical protein
VRLEEGCGLAGPSNALSVGTWNIGSGILGESHQKNAAAQLEYHVALLGKARPDVLSLQECHEFSDGRAGQAEEIAKGIGAQWHHAWAISDSHLDPTAKLSLGVLSKYRMSQVRTVKFKNPGLSSRGPGGEPWTMFDKGYMVAEIELPDATVRVVNAHSFPFHYFGASAHEPRFSSLWGQLAEDLLALAASGPTIVTIDLNYEPVGDLLGRIFEGQVFCDALGRIPTTPKGVQQDYILYTGSNVDLVDVSVVGTQADHHYCQALFEVAGRSGPGRQAEGG